jgi:hypothetical protein
MTPHELIAQLLHICICTSVAYGLLFSKTPEQAFCVLSLIIVVFLGLRLFKGCCLTQLEDGETTQIGMNFMLEDPKAISTHNFEEVAVGLPLLLQIIRTGLIMLNLDNLLF